MLIDLGQFAVQFARRLDVDVGAHIVDYAHVEQGRQHVHEGAARLLISGKDHGRPLCRLNCLVDGGQDQGSALQRGYRPGINAAHYQDDVGGRAM